MGSDEITPAPLPPTPTPIPVPEPPPHLPPPLPPNSYQLDPELTYIVERDQQPTITREQRSPEQK